MPIWIFIFACSEKDTENTDIEEVVVDPAQSGSYRIATKSRPFVNRHGQESAIQYWYPVQEEKDRLHTYGDIVESQVQDGGTPNCSEVRSVVMFSHGNGGMRYQSFFLMEYLASHGFVVVAPDHMGNTAFDMDASRSELTFRRPEDIMDAYDVLLENEDFSNCIQEEQGYAMIGHSFGGYTTLALSGAVIDTEAVAELCSVYPDAWLCEGVTRFAEENGAGIYDRTDTRIWAGVPMTPAGYEALSTTLQDITIPMLVWGGGKDELTPMEWMVTPIYEALRSSKNMGEIPLAGHYSFTNACDILPAYPDCGEGFLPPEDVQKMVNEITTAFLFKELGYVGWEDSWPRAFEELIWHE